MQAVQNWLEQAYEDRIKSEYDVVAIVIGSEGVGKSTFMTELAGRYEALRGAPTDPDDILEHVVWQDRQEFKSKISGFETRSPIVIHDAARVMHKRESMVGEQREVEKDMLDVRRKEFLMLFGYQDWDVVASLLQERRAQFAFKIPERGRVHGYNRDSIDHKVQNGEWPRPDLADTFPDLSGTELWDRFCEIDEEKKNERMAGDEDPDPKEAAWNEQAKVVLRATKPWLPSNQGLSNRQAASLIEYSEAWVSDRRQEWKAGEWDDVDGVEPPSEEDQAEALTL